MNLLNRCCVLALAVLISACAAPPLKKLDAPMAESEKADHVVIYIVQSEVTVDDVDVQNAGGGLLGVLIESAVESAKTKNRQEAIAPLRDALLDLEFEAKLIAAIKNHLPRSLVKADAEVKLVRNDDEWFAHLHAVAPANVFVVTPRYAFEQNFDIAYVHALAQLQHYGVATPEAQEVKRMTRNQREAFAPTVLHAGSYYSEHVTFGRFEKNGRRRGDAGYEDNAADWRRDNAQPVRDAFVLALDEIAALIERDGEQPLPRDRKRDTRAYLANFFMQPMLQKAAQIDQSEGRRLLMLGENAHWVDERQVKP